MPPPPGARPAAGVIGAAAAASSSDPDGDLCAPLPNSKALPGTLHEAGRADSAAPGPAIQSESAPPGGQHPSQH